MRKWKNKGFSLIELIIVVAIMSILLAIVVPTFIKYYERARKTRDLEGAKVICTSFERILAIEPEARKEWDDPKNVNPNNFMGFKVTDYSGNKYYLANIFEYTMTRKGEITYSAGTKDNAREGAVRDATGKYKICKSLLIEELTTNISSMAYQGSDLRSFRLARRMDTGEPEVWVCYVPKGSDGEGHTNGWIQYRLYPDPDPRYMNGEEAPKFQNTAGYNVKNKF